MDVRWMMMTMMMMEIGWLVTMMIEDGGLVMMMDCR